VTGLLLGYYLNDDDGFPTVALVFLNRGFEKGPKVKIMPQPVKTFYPGIS